MAGFHSDVQNGGCIIGCELPTSHPIPGITKPTICPSATPTTADPQSTTNFAASCSSTQYGSPTPTPIGLDRNLAANAIGRFCTAKDNFPIWAQLEAAGANTSCTANGGFVLGPQTCNACPELRSGCGCIENVQDPFRLSDGTTIQLTVQRSGDSGLGNPADGDTFWFDPDTCSRAFLTILDDCDTQSALKMGGTLSLVDKDNKGLEFIVANVVEKS